MDKLKYGKTMTIEEAIEILQSMKSKDCYFKQNEALDVAISVLLEQKDIYKNKDNCKYNYDCEHCGYSECIKIRVCRKIDGDILNKNKREDKK